MRSVTTDVSTSVQRVIAQQPPPILAALESLGVVSKTIQQRLRMSPTAISLWRSGRPIHPRHRAKLIAILREAHDATRLLVEQIEQQGIGTPGELAELKRRIDLAARVLREEAA